MKAYINGIGSVSAQPTFGNQPFDKAISYSTGILSGIEPDTAAWIEPQISRRMSKIIRMAVTSALLSLKEAGVKNPDAIIAGTGFGCLNDTRTFLTKLIQNREEALNPTPFIQSTHNTMASQIALLLKCHGYNQTFTQRALSFEHSLQDALMLLQENPDFNILVGGVDELTDLSGAFADQLNLLARCSDSLKLFEEENLGTIHGEGSAFFTLSKTPKNAWAELVGLTLLNKPQTSADVNAKIDQLLRSANINKKDIDIVLLGLCGDSEYDELMLRVSSTSLKDQHKAVFKNLCGEYSTASSFALWIACMALRSGFLPREIFLEGNKISKTPKTILIYNQYFNQHHSLILVKHVEG